MTADVTADVTAGDEVFGPASSGAADFALLSDYVRIPAQLDFAQAATLPVAVETATCGLDELGVQSGHTLLINGGGAVTASRSVAAREIPWRHDHRAASRRREMASKWPGSGALPRA